MLVVYEFFVADSKSLPPELTEILARVQNAADYMPWWQTEVGQTQHWQDCPLSTNLGLWNGIGYACASLWGPLARPLH